MWSGGKETSEQGETVLLFAPSSSSVADTSSSCVAHSASSSTIGGRPAYFDHDEVGRRYINELSASSNDSAVSSSSAINPKCELCQETMHLIAQINAPVECQHLNRTLYLFGCNRSQCWREATDDTKSAAEESSDIIRRERFLCGGDGVVRCVRSQQIEAENPAKHNDMAVEKNNTNIANDDNMGGWGEDKTDSDANSDGGWGDADGEDDAADDWGEGSDDNVQMDDLEAMLSACEMSKTTGKKTAGKHKKNKSESRSGISNVETSPPDLYAFKRLELEMYEEPYASTRSDDYSQDEDDDDAVGAAGATDDKINELLSKYLAEEEDQFIVSAIDGAGRCIGRSSASGDGGGGGGSGEKFERLPPDERAFLSFTDRIKRSPEQVVRYAYGGEALWSVPTPTIDSKSSKGNESGGDGNRFPDIPRCACGARRIFEAQLLPSILFVLDVDAQAQEAQQQHSSSTKGRQQQKLESEFGNGGMDWGALAIYSCAESCDQSREEFVVAQKTVDGTPVRREFAMIESEGEKGDNAQADGDKDDK